MPDVIVECAVYRDGRRAAGPAGPDLPESLGRARAGDGAFVWLELHDPTGEELDLVAGALGLRPGSVAAALAAGRRPGLEVHRDALLLVLRPVGHDGAAGEAAAGRLVLLVGGSLAVCVRYGGAAAASLAAEARERLEREPELLRYGPAAVVCAVSDAVVDQCADAAARLQADLDELEEEVFTPGGRSARAVARRIHALKRQLLEFRRAAGPLAGPVERLAGASFLGRRSQPLLRDAGDRLARVNEQVETLDRLLSDVLSAHLAQIGVRQDADLRRISAWAAMAAVPTMVAGVYGMNFRHMPELHWAWSYPAALAVTASAVAVLYGLFKRRGWLQADPFRRRVGRRARGGRGGPPASTRRAAPRRTPPV